MTNPRETPHVEGFVKRWLAIASLAAILAAGCGDDTDTTGVRPRISVQATHVDENDNPLLDFGPSPVLLPRKLSLVITNRGRAPLEIRAFELNDESGVFSIDPDPSRSSLRQGEEVEVVVTFRPTAQEGYEGSILIRSNDPSRESVRVGLEGVGSTIGRVEIEPDAIDFGMVGEWTQEVRNVRIASVGSAPLLVESIELVEGSSAAFAILGSTRPTELPAAGDQGPGGEVVIQIACAPTDAIEEDAPTGTLRIRTTDPDRREVDIPLSASINRAPFAEFDVHPANHAPHLPILLDATDSHDPDGHEPLSFAWRVVHFPVGTTVEFDDPTSPTPTVTFSHPGTYRIGLDVYDALGLACRAPEGSQTLPCAYQDIDIRSEDDIVVELTWKHKLTDLDLHLLEGDAELYSDGDCFWANQRPDFGFLGDDADDPRFTRESLKGFGPEEIVFSKPSAGTYRVVVEFAKTNGADEPETEAIVNVYVFGKLSAQMTATLTAPKQIWEVLTIEWPAAVVTPVDEIREASQP